MCLLIWRYTASCSFLAFSLTVFQSSDILDWGWTELRSKRNIMIRYVVMWYNMICMIRYDVLLYMICYDMMWCDMIYYMIRYDVMWYPIISDSHCPFPATPPGVSTPCPCSGTPSPECLSFPSSQTTSNQDRKYLPFQGGTVPLLSSLCSCFYSAKVYQQ